MKKTDKNRACHNHLFLLIFFASIFLAANSHAASAQWTIMVYMAGENNLSQSLKKDLEEMKRVGSSPQVNILVQADTGLPGLISEDGFTHRFKVEKGWLKDFPLGYNADMASPYELSNFITWAKTNFPARHYVLILWDHGLGWVGGDEDSEQKSKSAPIRGILQDQGSNSFMSLSELNEALSLAGVNFDIIEFDACLMGMWEVAVSIENFSRFTTFSQANEPATGNPYDQLFEEISRNPYMTPREFSQLIVKKYISYYENSSEIDLSVTKSAIDLSRLGELSKKIDDIAWLLKDSFSEKKNEFLSIRENTQEYPSLPGSIDLFDFLKGLSTLKGPLSQKAKEIMEFLSNDIFIEVGLHNSQYSSNIAGFSDLSGSHGISIFLPYGFQLLEGELSQYEKTLSSQKAPNWFEFVKQFSESTGISNNIESTQGNFLLGLYWKTNPSIALFYDLDLYIIEPGGDVYASWMGRNTPNGHFSLDSRISMAPFEFYSANPIVRKGIYIPVINLTLKIPYLFWPEDIETYFYYLPDFYEDLAYQVGPHIMNFENPAPLEWDDHVIELLSQNYYSNWWIPGGIERYLSRLPKAVKEKFWHTVQKKMIKRQEKRFFYMQLY